MATDIIAQGLAANLVAPVAAVAPAAKDPFYLAATGMDANQFLSLYTPSGSQIYGASANAAWSPDYPVRGYRFFFCNWVLRGSTTLSAEVDGNANIVIEGACVVINGVRTQLTFSGAASRTLTPGQGVWSDELPIFVQPRSKMVITTCWNATTTASGMMGSFYPNVQIGEGFVLSATTQTAYLTSGTVPYTAPTSLYAYGPNAAIARGSDGRDVVLVVGDSIATGTGEANFASDARNNRGWACRWLDSTAGGARRIAHGKLCVPSATCRVVLLASDIARQTAMFSVLPNMPFTKLFIQRGINDATGTSTLWVSRITVHNLVFKAAFGVPVLETGFTPYTTTDNTQFTTAAGQSYVTSHDWPSGITQQAQNSLAALPSGVDQFLFIEDAFDGRFVSGGAEGKWRNDISKVNNILQASAALNATTILLRGPVDIGTALALNAGVATSQAVTVTAVSGVGNVTCTIFPALTIARASGEPARGIAMQDGLHPSSEMAAFAADYLAPKKQLVFA